MRGECALAPATYVEKLPLSGFSVDAYLLDWLLREPLRREWFFEQRDGNCRLMGSFAVRLSESARTWGRAVAPIAEWIAHELGPQFRNQTADAFLLRA
jgi:hypothetical protein